MHSQMVIYCCKQMSMHAIKCIMVKRDHETSGCCYRYTTCIIIYFNVMQEYLGLCTQSPRNVVLDPQTGTAALYCIATQHKSTYVYTWSCRDKVVGCNSPVLWVAVSGLYRCDVAHNLTTERCTTNLINVIYDVTNEGLYSHYFLMLSVLFQKRYTS